MIKGTRISVAIAAAAVFTVAAMSISAESATCDVPSGSHPNIQAAVDDSGCGPIVIAAGSYPESVVIARTLNLVGAGSDQTFIQGQVQIFAGAVHLAGMHISAADEALFSTSGAEVSGFDLVVFNGDFEPPLFADGFETGNTDAWSAAAP